MLCLLLQEADIVIQLCVYVYLKVCLHSLLPELSITLFSAKLECIIKARLLESIFSFFKENLKQKTETVDSTHLKRTRCSIYIYDIISWEYNSHLRLRISIPYVR